MRLRPSIRSALAVAASTVVLVGCSDTTADSEDDSPDDRADEQLIASSVTGLGQDGIVLDAELAERHLFVLYQVTGDLDRTAATCATAGFIDAFGGTEALDGVPLAELLSEDTQKARRDAAAACETEPVGPTTSIDPFVEQPAEPLPSDVDPSMLRDHLVEMTTLAAIAQGFTDPEAACFGRASYGELDDDQILAVQRPEAYAEVELPERDGADEVRSCLTEERIVALAEQLRSASEGGADDGP